MRALIFAALAFSLSFCVPSNNNVSNCSSWCNFAQNSFTPLSTTFAIGTNILGYVTEPHGPLSQGQTITLNYTINGNGPYSVTDTSDIPPASITLFIWEKGDNLSGADQYGYYRWWCPTRGDLTAGNHTLSCVIGGQWTSVFGARADTPIPANLPPGIETPEQGFAQALANPYGVGFTFGGAYFYGHGVTDGGTTFTINSFTVQ